MRRYLPLALTLLVCGVVGGIVARDWSPWGQLAASAVLLIPPLYVVYRSGLAEDPKPR